ncbi:hypothetical protein, partial [Klebsiella pneumoniae]|uniref:hypothetical protein n=1 Tax=Klebsiella pneumoniae TaxID=573 RepID=UPI0034D6E8AB
MDWKLEVTKVSWRVPYVRLADEHRLSLLKLLDSDRDIVVPFRSWEMHEYPVLPTTKNHSWTIKSSTSVERPRYVIFGLQTGRKNSILTNANEFDTCKLTNIKLYLNSQFFPYDNLN